MLGVHVVLGQASAAKAQGEVLDHPGGTAEEDAGLRGERPGCGLDLLHVQASVGATEQGVQVQLTVLIARRGEFGQERRLGAAGSTAEQLHSDVRDRFVRFRGPNTVRVELWAADLGSDVSCVLINDNEMRHRTHPRRCAFGLPCKPRSGEPTLAS